MIEKVEKQENPDLTQETAVICKAFGQQETQIRKSVVVEHALDVYLNGKPLLTLNCSPIQLDELVIGHLFSEGFLDNISELEHIEICKNGSVANVTFSQIRRGKITFLDSTKSVSRNGLKWDPGAGQKADLKPLPRHFWNYQDVLSLSKTFHVGSPLYLKTRGVHSCMLYVGGEVIVHCEDIGRHNALDKAIGYTVKNRVDTSHAIIFSSGRITADSVRKAIRCGLPVLITNSVPTGQAVELAREYNLTLLGEVKDQHISIFAG